MKYVTIYSPTGEPLEVAEPRAATLLKDGWTLKKGEPAPEAPESAGNGVDALVDSETQAEEVPVDIVEEDNEAGPVPAVHQPNYVDTSFSEPVEVETTKSRRSRRSTED